MGIRVKKSGVNSSSATIVDIASNINGIIIHNFAALGNSTAFVELLQDDGVTTTVISVARGGNGAVVDRLANVRVEAGLNLKVVCPGTSDAWALEYEVL